MRNTTLDNISDKTRIPLSAVAVIEVVRNALGSIPSL